MGKRHTIQVGSLFGGWSSTRNFFDDGQFLHSIGIDPEWPMSDSVGDRMASGVLRPTSYADFSSTAIDANPYWFLTSPKTSLFYAVLNNGSLISYSSSFGSETDIGAATSSSGNGAAYYNNYIYIATNTDISRYGPLDGTPSLTNSVWSGTTLGSQSALTNTTYPSIRGGGTLPNHVMHPHVDNKLYVADFKNGQGQIHFIKTKKGTDEGDTDDGSSYNALDLPFGYMPTCMASYGNHLVIGAIQTSNSTLKQGLSALFFWDTVDDSFYQVLELPDVLVTAIKNVNNVLYIWTGPSSTGSDVSNGYRLSAYLGGQSVETIYFSEVGAPPLAGAVDAFGNKVVWGTFTQIPTTTASSPEYYGVVMSFNSKNPSVPSGIQCIAAANATGAAGDGMVTALKYAQQASFSKPQMIIGWRDASDYGIDKASTTYGTSVWRSQMVMVGRPFTITEIRFPLGAAVAANMTLTPKIFLDDFSSSSTSNLTAVNNTNYAASERHIRYEPSISGDHNFCLELRWSGTALLPVMLPLEITFEIDE